MIQGELQPWDGVGAQLLDGGPGGGAAAGVGGYEKIPHPRLQRPAVDLRAAIPLGHDEEQSEQGQRREADCQMPPLFHPQQCGSAVGCREEKNRAGPSGLQGGCPTGKLAAWTGAKQRADGRCRFGNGW